MEIEHKLRQWIMKAMIGLNGNPRNANYVVFSGIIKIVIAQIKSNERY